MNDKDSSPVDDEDTVVVAREDTVVTPDDTIITRDDTIIVTNRPPGSSRPIVSPLSDEDRKRFFRPPVGDPGSVVPVPPRDLPPTTRPINAVSGDPLAPEPKQRKSFDEIIAGEFHRMTDAIPLVGRNSKGEPRRAAVVIGLVVAIAVVAGVVVTVAITLALQS